MAKGKAADLVSVRIKRKSRKRFKTRAAKEDKDFYQVVDEASLR
jgi:hypothetical protein